MVELEKTYVHFFDDFGSVPPPLAQVTKSETSQQSICL
jgi:hypothetical protein